MNRIWLDLSTLYFVAMEPGGVTLFIDGDGSEIRLSCSGSAEEIRVAIGELAKAVRAASGYREDSVVDPRD